MVNGAKQQTQQKNPLLSKIATVISVLLGVYAVLYLSGALQFLGIAPVVFVHNAIVMAVLSILAFLIFPAWKGGPQPRAIPWYDFIFLILIAVPLFYLVFFIDLVMEHIVRGYSTTYEVVLAIMVFIGLLEAIRRTVGLGLSIIVLLFLIYPLIATNMPGIFLAPVFSLERVAYQIYLTSDGIIGMPVAVIATIVISFILFGQVLQVTGGGKAILNVATSLMGGFRGGPAKVAVFASGLFGSISGSTIANVATTGSITIPMMKQMGYKPEFAAAIETVAANGGQILPPIMGAVAFLMAQITGIPYIQVTFHAFLSAVLYYIIEFVIVDRESARLGLSPIPRSARPGIKKSLADSLVYLIPVIFLVYLLAVLHYSVGKAGLWAALVMVIVTFFKKETRLTRRGVVDSLDGTVRSLVMVTMACAGAGIIIGSLTLTALGASFSYALVQLSGGNLLVLLGLTAIACFIFGMVGSGIAAYLALSTLIAPAMVQMGVPLVAAHLFIVWWAITAYITPPVAIGVYAASAIADSDMMKTGWWAVRLGIGTFIIPFMYVYNPALVMLGSAGDIILEVITALIGMIALSLGVIGYVYRQANWGQRVLFMAGGMGLAYSGFTIPGIGLALVIVAMLWHMLTSRRQPTLRTGDK